MSKLLFVQEHVRTDHTIQHQDGTVTIDFLATTTGRKLLSETNKYGITRRDIDIAYMYPFVPEPTRVTPSGKPISYKDIPLGEASKYHEQIIDKIVKGKPKVVVPNGRLGCKFFVDEVSIMNNRGIPVEKTVTNEEGQSHSFWVFPIYSMEFYTLRPSVGRQLENDLKTLKDYLERGDKAFIPSEVDYDLIEDFNEVMELFDYIEKNKPTTAWDLETNTLKPELDGAKALVISISIEEKTGVAFPLEHKNFKWGEGEFEKILERFEKITSSKEIPKVGANIKFDIRFLMSVYGFKNFNYNMDVQVAYWMTVSQERNASRRLSNLAYEFTDMGGYDAELEEWIKQYKKDYRKENGKKPENEIDGSDINYEWIPYDMLMEYAAGDADVTLRIHNELMDKVKESEKWVEMYTGFYPRMSAAIARTEANGLNLNLDYAREIVREYNKEEERLVNAMRDLPSIKILEEEHREYYEIGLKEWEKPPAERDKELAKWRNTYKNKLEFNPRSGADKGKALFDILGVRLPFDKVFVKDKPWTNKNPKTIDDLSWEDFSTSKDSLNEILEGNYKEEAKKLAELMMEHSSVATLRSNFAEKAEDDMADDGAIHGSLNETGTACVTGDTLINTDEGISLIADISKNRKPGTFSDVDLKTVTREGIHDIGGFYYQGKAKGRKITLADGNTITTTNNHQLLSNNFIKRGKAINRKQKAYQESHRYNNSWVRADKLTTDDYLVVRYGEELYGNNLKLNWDSKDYEQRTNAKEGLKLPKELTENLAEFLGMYMADGSYSTNNGSFSLSLANNNSQVINLFRKHIKSLFGLESRLYKGSSDRSDYITVSSINLGRYLEKNFKLTSRAETKDVPSRILAAPKNIQQAFIRGLTLDTGVQKKDYPHVYFSSTSRGMMRKLHAMMMNMGMYVRLADRKTYKDNRNPTTEVMVTGNSINIFMEEVGFIEDRKTEVVNKSISSYNHVEHYIGTYNEPELKTAFVRVRSIEEVEDEFFDINVPHNNSYLGNSIINHNTSRLSSSQPKIDWAV